MTEVILESEYFLALNQLKLKIEPYKFDCIVALKRSGWIGGAYLSNQLTIPVFTSSEIESIPKKFKNILIFDDKSCTGKSIHKVVNKLLDRNIKTAVLFKQGYYNPSIFISNKNEITRMFYENHKI